MSGFAFSGPGSHLSRFQPVSRSRLSQSHPDPLCHRPNVPSPVPSVTVPPRSRMSRPHPGPESFGHGSGSVYPGPTPYLVPFVLVATPIPAVTAPSVWVSSIQVPLSGTRCLSPIPLSSLSRSHPDSASPGPTPASVQSPSALVPDRVRLSRSHSSSGLSWGPSSGPVCPVPTLLSRLHRSFSPVQSAMVPPPVASVPGTLFHPSCLFRSHAPVAPVPESTPTVPSVPASSVSVPALVPSVPFPSVVPSFAVSPRVLSAPVPLPCATLCPTPSPSPWSHLFHFHTPVPSVPDPWSLFALYSFFYIPLLIYCSSDLYALLYFFAF